jgi:hypothetical protein
MFDKFVESQKPKEPVNLFETEEYLATVKARDEKAELQKIADEVTARLAQEIEEPMSELDDISIEDYAAKYIRDGELDIATRGFSLLTGDPVDNLEDLAKIPAIVAEEYVKAYIAKNEPMSELDAEVVKMGITPRQLRARERAERKKFVSINDSIWK